MNGQSNESNPCQLCNASQSKDTWTENPGMLTQCSHQLLSFCFYQTLKLDKKLIISIVPLPESCMHLVSIDDQYSFKGY